MPTILCIDEEPATGVMLEDALGRIGHQAIVASSFKEGLSALNREPIDLIISDHRVSDGSGRDLLDHLREEGHDIPVIITTGYASVESAVLSMRRGAADYLTKPFRFEALRIAVNNALEVCKLRRDNEGFQKEISFRRAIVGQSNRVRSLMETIAAVAPTRATVLLEGESGTGKELLARAIHEQSPRSAQPYVTINCAALPEGLVESTLFGHERGSFTGATTRSIGAFERAHRGTLVLDEVSEMRLDLQAKLLRVVQEQEFERVGGGQRVKVDVRLIATTNRNLEEEVEAGRFRRDLYYRLSVVPIRTPPLRERLEDVPLLVQHFVDQYAKELGLKKPEILPEAIGQLMQRSWPGNIRELENAIGRAMILSRDNRLTSASFDGAGIGSVPGSAASGEAPLPTSPKTLNLKVLEKAVIEMALAQTGGHRVRAAQLLGISERTLRNKLNGRNGDGEGV